MSDILVIPILLVLASPLLIPVTVTVLHAARGWRRHLRTFAASMNRAVRRVGPHRLVRQLSTSHAGSTDLKGGRELGWQFAE